MFSFLEAQDILWKELALLLLHMAYSISRSGGIEAAIPVLGAFAVGAQKILPALQQIYSSYTLIKGANDSTIDVLELLDQPLPTSFEKNDNKLFFNKNIIFKSVYFRYSDTSTYVLNDINLEFNKGDKIGIVGSTGTGKSTLIDLLMGLLKPTSGVVLVMVLKLVTQIEVMAFPYFSCSKTYSYLIQRLKKILHLAVIRIW